MSMPVTESRLRAPATGRETPLERIDRFRWRIPRDRTRGMLVDGIVFADEAMIEVLRRDPALEQVANVATLPGIVGASLAMPDLHWGYGFPIGGVAATRLSDGVISPGGIGFDIDCGVRLIRSDLTEADVRPRLEELVGELFRSVPSGLGAHTRSRVSDRELDEVMVEGSRWALARGLGWEEDAELTEEGGRLTGADPSRVSRRAHQRGADQLGTLGSGNHFLEVDVVDRIHDTTAADAFSLRLGQVVVFIHCGSRGLGHQVCTDHVAAMDRAMSRYGISVPDRQLACAPIGSDEGRAYLAAMAAACGFAWANRQVITHEVRNSFAAVFGASAERLGLHLVYDVSHNIAKFERHLVDGEEQEVCVHRKGATRAFPPGHPDVPARYAAVGQPVLVPGDMGRCSYVGVGTASAMTAAFGSTCHGAGRRLSRHAALQALRGVDVAKQLEASGVLVRAERPDLLSEEASIAYKDVDAVVDVAEGAGLMRRVARIRPIAVVKG